MSAQEEDVLAQIMQERGLQEQDDPLQQILLERGLAEDVDTSPLPSPRPRPPKSPLSLMPDLEPDPMLVAAAESGVLTDKPAKRGHFLASLAFDDKNRVAAYKKLLGDDVDIRVGPKTGQIEYFDRDSKRYSLVNPPGLNMADIEGMGGAAITLVPEIVGGVAGGIITKSPWGVPIGAGAGVYVGEVARYAYGIRMGINEDITDQQIMRRAAANAGIATGAGVLGENLVKGGKLMIDLIQGRVVPSRVAETLEIEMSEAIDLVDAINARLGTTEFKLNMAQASGDEDLLVMADFFKRSPEFSAMFREFNETQQAALVNYYNAINRPYRSRLSTQEAGQRVQDIAETNVQREQFRQDEIVRMKEAELQALMVGLHTRPYESLGPILREVGTAEQVAFRGWADEAADALDATAGRQPFIPNNQTHAVVMDMDEQAQDALVSMVAAEKRKLIGASRLDAADEELNRIFDPEATFTFRQMWESISALKRIERVASKGLSTDAPAVGDVRRLYMAMEADMTNAMNGSPLRAEYERFVRRYAQEKARLDQGFVEDLMSREGGRFGRFNIADDKVTDRFLVPGNHQPAEDVFNLIQNNPQAMDATRQSILDHWQRTVAPEGEVSITAHRRWLNQHLRSAAVFMNQRELRQMVDPATTQLALNARREARKRALDKLNKTFDARLVNLNNPGRIVPMLMDAKDPAQARQIMAVIKDVPDVQRAVRAAVRKDIADKVVGQYSQGERFFSASRLDDYLNGRAGEKGVRENLTEVFGKSYVSDMDTLLDALKAVQSEAQFPNRSNTAFWIDTVKNLSRAYVGLFTRPGRVITAVDRLRGRAANRVFARALLNPEDLRALVAMKGTDMRTRKARTLISSLGGSALLNDFEPLPGEVPDE